MPRFLTALLAVAALIVSLQVHPSHAASSQSRTLYSTDFSKGASNWIAGDDLWTVTPGRVHFSLGEKIIHQLYAPIAIPKTLKNFSVQARMRAPSPIKKGGFGVFVRDTGNQDNSGVFAGTFYNGSELDNILFTYGKTYATTQVDPGTAWHTYVLAVKGTRFTLKFDGQAVCHGTIPKAGSGPYVGIWGEYKTMAVKSFKVTALK